MKKNKKIIYALVSLFLIVGIIIIYTIKSKNNIVDNVANAGDLKESKYTPKEINTADINLDDEIVNLIKDSDEKNADKNVENYKRLIVELDVPKEYQEKINEALKKGNNPEDIFTCYNFLYEKYGQAEDIFNLLKEKNSFNSWESVFKEYDKKNQEFVPSDFKDGLIDEVLKDGSLNTNDIMIADRISQKGLGKFEDLIEQRKKEGNWQKIKLDLGVLNLEEALYSTAITSADVKKYSSNNVTEDQVIKTLSIARKANIDNEDLIKKLVSSNNDEEIYSKIYANKYSN